ncbi:hypothetical protein [Amaricoccus solimangrovi]|uniref:Uncharacterized protein n=1 Tax=Amaricoccus solimangrovi TaxID=2589815 RepID=A0A501WJS9_9RHOB|nr:hypothetical protein [Amaricoccus solimangrovi]TPE50133.1 hypothetical protein FJM51_12120 [Amaricoccus solimangrovi]
MFFRDAPLGRIDSNLIATLAGATAVDRTVRLVAQVADPGSLALAARRFVEVEVPRFALGGGKVFMTATDLIALGTGGSCWRGSGRGYRPRWSGRRGGGSREARAKARACDRRGGGIGCSDAFKRNTVLR